MNPYITVIGIAIAVIVGGAVGMYYIESPSEDAQIKTMLDAFWWTIATTTTVGYGDVVPVTDLGRTVAIFYMFFGISVAGIFVSIIGTRYYKRQVEPKEDQEIRYEKKILERIDELKKQQEENSKNLQDQIKNLEEKLKKEIKEGK